MSRREKEKNRQKQVIYRQRLAENGYRIVSVKARTEDAEAIKKLAATFSKTDKGMLKVAAATVRGLSIAAASDPVPVWFPEKNGKYSLDELLALVADLLDSTLGARESDRESH